VIDAHSDAFQRDRWTRPAWLNRLVQRRAAAVLVTDEHWAQELRTAGANGTVIPDVPQPMDVPPHAARADGRFTILVVNTWAGDEPLTEVLAAAMTVPDAEFQVTGFADERVAALGPLPANVRFTGFLPADEYVMAMAGADAVMCLTTRDHTMQRGACEALSLARPIITSDWPLLRSYFERGTVHVDNTARGIADGVRQAMAAHEELLAQVADLRQRRFTEWQARREELMQLLEGARA
jgi:glycosyltransferase involved in cell wall biosynthesis